MTSEEQADEKKTILSESECTDRISKVVDSEHVLKANQLIEDHNIINEQRDEEIHTKFNSVICKLEKKIRSHVEVNSLMRSLKHDRIIVSKQLQCLSVLSDNDLVERRQDYTRRYKQLLESADALIELLDDAIDLKNKIPVNRQKSIPNMRYIYDTVKALVDNSSSDWYECLL